jgi:hypothetical protein
VIAPFQRRPSRRAEVSGSALKGSIVHHSKIGAPMTLRVKMRTLAWICPLSANSDRMQRSK